MWAIVLVELTGFILIGTLEQILIRGKYQPFEIRRCQETDPVGIRSELERKQAEIKSQQAGGSTYGKN